MTSTLPSGAIFCMDTSPAADCFLLTHFLIAGALFVPMSVNIPEANCLLPQQVDPRLREVCHLYLDEQRAKHAPIDFIPHCFP
jgi:hypothetical protein